MVLIKPVINTIDGIVSLELSAPNMPSIRIPRVERDPVIIPVWGDVVKGMHQGDEAANWLSKFLGRPVALFG